MSVSSYEELADYRRSVAHIYSHVRLARPKVEKRWEKFCQERDLLFATHPQSALSPEQKREFSGLHYYPYNPELRFLLHVDIDVEPLVMEDELPEEGLIRLKRFGKIHVDIDGQAATLSLFWIVGYAGGIFLPFRDLTNQATTYGGGRYLLDTIKHADLGYAGDRIVIDFNFAYNPSCAYNPRWVCPLAPTENWLNVPIRAGELRFIIPA